MKKTTILFVLLSIFSFSQNSKIYPKNKIILGEENIFVYEPAKQFSVPENTFAHYISTVNYKKSPLKKRGNQYEFTVKLPDSIRTFVVIFKDGKDSFSDTNLDKTYSYYLKNTKNGKAQAEKLNLMNWAKNAFNIQYSDKKLVGEYENLFKQYPKLRNDSEADFYYMVALNNSNPEKAKKIFEKNSQDYEKQQDENSMMKAYELYQYNLNNPEKAEQLSKLMLEKFPNGKFAKRIQYFKIYNNFGQPNPDEKLILQQVEDFKTQFSKDKNDKQILDQIYLALLNLAIKTKNWDKINTYSQSLSQSFYAANIYNENAWKIADGDHINSEGKDLDFAETLARKSLELLDYKTKNLGKYEDKEDFNQPFMFYTDALAMVLYKQKKFKEAFDEQNKIINFDFLDDSNRERYVLYAEKVKDPNFVKNYIENILREKNISDNLFNKLTDIYNSQNIPTSEIEKLQTNNKKIATKTARERLYKFYGGDLKAKDFSLTNLEGKTVKLSDYRGKIVVLDFWATWCHYCIESFPHMQDLVKSYKGQNVEFLFVNTKENTKPEETKKAVTKFITDKKYDFNVVFDLKNSVYQNYKIEGIPCEIIIDKEGNIISRSEGYDGNLGTLITENL